MDLLLILREYIFFEMSNQIRSFSVLRKSCINVDWAKSVALSEKSRCSDGTPLHFAVRAGRLDVINILLDRGADPNASGTGSFISKTPLEEVFEGFVLRGKQRLDVVKLLLAHGANPNTSGGGATPLLRAILCLGFQDEEPVDVVELLLDHGANPNTAVGDDIPLLCAVKNSYVEIVKLLLKRGANINAQNEFGYTALHQAVSRYFSKFEQPTRLIRLLLARGAYVNESDSYRGLPLGIAVEEGYLDFVKLLLKAGADPCWQRNGETPLDLAHKKGDRKIVRVIERYIKNEQKKRTALVQAAFDQDKHNTSPLALLPDDHRVLKKNSRISFS